jgi:hypothetical protein
VTDYRDVLMWASQPEPTPEERAAAWARTQEMVREHERARRRHLESEYGIEGAEQVERSNKKLFGKPSTTDHALDPD